MGECISLMEEALRSLARGDVQLPLRHVMRVGDTRDVFALMPSFSTSLHAVGAKLITVFPGNHARGQDSHQGVVLLFDAGDGSLRAIADASSITAIRTAAVSGVATRLLSRDASSTVAILGSGQQARTHVDAMLAVRSIREFRVWSRNRAHAEAFAKEVSERRRVRAAVCEGVREAVQSADIVCTVTSSTEPVLRGEWLAPGTHVNAVGASVPAARELDNEAVRRARLFVDRRESTLAESGDVLTPIREGAIGPAHILAEIGEVLEGASGRGSSEEITVFKSLGVAIEDLACVHYLHGRAKATGSGTWLDL